MTDVARCRHCAGPIERQPGQFWKHRSSQQARCMPGTRNAQTADPDGGWRRHV